MIREEQTSLIFDLINAFRLVKTPYETALLIQDLLTADEVKHLAKRLRIAKLILKGETHRNIVEKLDCSLATVTKVNLWLKQGGEGLKQVISKLPVKYDLPKNLPAKSLEFQLPQVLLATAEYIISKRQSIPADRLIEKMKDKKALDQILQDSFDDQFRK